MDVSQSGLGRDHTGFSPYDVTRKPINAIMHMACLTNLFVPFYYPKERPHSERALRESLKQYQWDLQVFNEQAITFSVFFQLDITQFVDGLLNRMLLRKPPPRYVCLDDSPSSRTDILTKASLGPLDTRRVVLLHVFRRHRDTMPRFDITVVIKHRSCTARLLGSLLRALRGKSYGSQSR